MILLFSGFLTSPLYAKKDHFTEKENLSSSDFFLFPVRFFRKFLSGADGDRCTMHPSCSTYSIEALKKNGPVIGYFMTCDRLMRCGRDEKKISPPVFSGGRLKTRDPVSNNDFWWKYDGEEN
jgi:putative component of membrane protein insertase Oxa1/YidC/SpoIIIJ protein YidD